MPDNFEVTTTVDKDQRDAMFRDLKANGNELEKQAVKYSSVEPVPDQPGKFRSTWSVAYPRT